MKKTDCKTCDKEYTPMCDYMQGRCPHHSALISTQVIRTRIQNIINFFKGNNK
jgi:excinuclease UvrABC nuclease subunit